MSVSRENTIVAAFRRDEDARRALAALERDGFTDDQIGYAFHDGGNTGAGGVTIEPGDTKVGEGAAGGAAAGGLIGGLIGAAVAGVIPGIGPVVAAGVLAAVLGGAAAGAVPGGLLGAVIGLGVSDEDARYFEDVFNKGGSLVVVRADDRMDDARRILAHFGGSFTRGDDAARPETARSDTPDTGAITGETDTMRRGGTRTPQEDQPIAGDRVTNPTTDDPERMSIAGQYPADPPSFPQRDWDTAREDYRSDFERRFAAHGRVWEDAEPGYRYGHEMAQDPRFHGRRWEDVQPELRAGFEEWYASRTFDRTTDDRFLTAWEGVEEHVRDAWEGLTGSDVARDDQARERETRGRARDINDEWRGEDNPHV